MNNLEGPQVDFPYLVACMKPRTATDFAAVLARFDAFPGHVDDVLALMDEGIRQSRVFARVCVEAVPAQIDGLLGEAAGTPFFKHFAGAMEGVEAGARERLRADAAAKIEARVQPAFRKLKAYLEEVYLPACRTTADGIACADLPDGKAHYEQCLRFHTSTALTAEEIHAMGLAEVERIRGEMERVKDECAFDGDLKAFIADLRASADFRAGSEEELLQKYRDRLAFVVENLPSLFSAAPELPLTIMPTPAHQAPSAPAAYYLSQGKGNPGLFYVNTYRIAERPTYQIDTLLLHEAIPGHHMQAAYACRMEETGRLPSFRANIEDRRYNWAPSRRPFYSAYVEGWALYCEGLGKELGLYDDPVLYFGKLSFEATRAVRLVVDTGIHALGWSRDKAVDFMFANTALSRHEVETEITRYIGWPAQAVSYKVGELHIRGLRQKLEARFGSADRDEYVAKLKEFHDIVLRGGNVPLTFLTEEVEKLCA